MTTSIMMTSSSSPCSPYINAGNDAKPRSWHDHSYDDNPPKQPTSHGIDDILGTTSRQGNVRTDEGSSKAYYESVRGNFNIWTHPDQLFDRRHTFPQGLGLLTERYKNDGDRGVEEMFRRASHKVSPCRNAYSQIRGGGGGGGGGGGSMGSHDTPTSNSDSNNLSDDLDVTGSGCETVGGEELGPEARYSSVLTGHSALLTGHPAQHVAAWALTAGRKESGSGYSPSVIDSHSPDDDVQRWTDVRDTRHDRTPSSFSSADGCGDAEDKKRKKARTTFTGRQIFELEKQFEIKKYLSSTERAEMAALLHVTETQRLHNVHSADIQVDLQSITR